MTHAKLLSYALPSENPNQDAVIPYHWTVYRNSFPQGKLLKRSQECGGV